MEGRVNRVLRFSLAESLSGKKRCPFSYWFLPLTQGFRAPPAGLPKFLLVSCSWIAQSVPTLCDPMDRSRPGFSVHGILQARILEWVAIPSPGDLLDAGIELGSPALQMDSIIWAIKEGIKTWFKIKLQTYNTRGLQQKWELVYPSKTLERHRIESQKQCQTLFLGGSKITADSDCSHEIKRCLLLGRIVMTNLTAY